MPTFAASSSSIYVKRSLPTSPFNRSRAFQSLPHGYLVLDRDFAIVDVNPTYARLTMTHPEQLIGRALFDAFPDNPGDPQANGVKNLTRSLNIVARDRIPHSMPWQRYDIRDQDGIFVERHWNPVNAPILNEHGDVEYIIHSVEDVTEAVKRIAKVLAGQR